MEPELAAYLADAHSLVVAEIRRIVPRDSTQSGQLYALMLEYPLRAAKALRPAICIATCRALGGRLEPVLPTAAVLELYHNAFLIHDDVEDGSEKRRDLPTLHETWGVPIAINVGDAMLALALDPLLANMRLLGMGKALRILQTVATMARESAEGQALELGWIRDRDYGQSDEAYQRMVEKKTSYYSFVAPARLGAIIAELEAERIEALCHFAQLLGVAFQIQDDVLNVAAVNEARYGKELCGDLWEGKLTLVLLHALRSATASERSDACQILGKARPTRTSIELLEAVSRLSETAIGSNRAVVEQLSELRLKLSSASKTPDEIAFLRSLIDRYGSLAHARAVARARAEEAGAALNSMGSWLRPSLHRSFLEGLVHYVIARDH